MKRASLEQHTPMKMAADNMLFGGISGATVMPTNRTHVPKDRGDTGFESSRSRKTPSL